MMNANQERGPEHSPCVRGGYLHSFRKRGLVNTAKAFTGELIGTFIMCFCGIGAVATATLFGALTGPGQVGLGGEGPVPHAVHDALLSRLQYGCGIPFA